MSLDPQLTGAALLIVGVLSVMVLGVANVFFSGFAFDLIAGGWLLCALGIVLMGGSPNE